MKKRPVVILSAPRTGSTALVETLQIRSPEWAGLQVFREPDWTGRMDEFAACMSSSKEFMLKVHAKKLSLYPSELLALLEQAYIITIQRRDIVAQLASLYVGRKRKQFVYRQAFQADVIEVDPVFMDQCCLDLIRFNSALASWLPRADENLVYEDLVLKSSDFVPTPYPSNYAEVLELAKRSFDSK